MEPTNNFKIDFIGIGAAKSATSWIYQCLEEHPQTCLPRHKGANLKETYFFCRDEEYSKGLDFYIDYFSHCLNGQIKGEFSAAYLHNKKPAPRIKKDFPDTKLIACLRNPIERVYSNYFYDKVRGKREQSFEESLYTVPEYIEDGKYYTWLAEYLNLFPRENILITIYEDIEKNPTKFIQSIYRFLGIDDSFVPASLYQKINFTSEDQMVIPWLSNANFNKWLNSLKKNYLGKQFIRFLKFTKLSAPILFIKRKNTKNELTTTNKSFVKPAMNPNTRKHLEKVYQNENKKLEGLINRDLSFWK